jgi:hypothetical protein
MLLRAIIDHCIACVDYITVCLQESPRKSSKKSKEKDPDKKSKEKDPDKKRKKKKSSSSTSTSTSSSSSSSTSTLSTSTGASVSTSPRATASGTSPREKSSKKEGGSKRRTKSKPISSKTAEEKEVLQHRLEELRQKAAELQDRKTKLIETSEASGDESEVPDTSIDSTAEVNEQEVYAEDSTDAEDVRDDDGTEDATEDGGDDGNDEEFDRPPMLSFPSETVCYRTHFGYRYTLVA